MPLPDPIGLRHKILSTTVISASYQQKGNRPHLCEAAFHNASDIFVVADGYEGFAHGDTAARLAVESAVWTVSLAKQKPSYWKDKKLLGKRIIRSSHLALYNKRRENGFEDGLGSTLSLLLFGDRNFFIYNVGNSRIYLYRKRALQLLTPLDCDNGGRLTKLLGVAKEPPQAFFYTKRLHGNDTFVLMTDGAGDYISDEEIKECLEHMKNTKESILNISKQIADLAASHGSTDAMTVSVVKNIVY